MNNKDVLCNKYFDSDHTEQEQEQKIITLPSFVSTCLTRNHSECNGSYEDTFHLFRLVCNCQCHQSPSEGKSQLTAKEKEESSKEVNKITHAEN
jgi:hypothetical protein